MLNKLKNQKNIEIEYRSRFSEVDYKRLFDFLTHHAKNLGQDDKDVFFFIMPDKLLKVVNEIAKKKAKIVLKLNKIGKGSDFEELEIPIRQDSVMPAVRLFKHLELTNNIMHSFQKRHNFFYRGVEIALKHSDEWDYHAELETVISNTKDKKDAIEKIAKVTKELDIRLMSEKELREFTRKAEIKYRRKRI